MHITEPDLDRRSFTRRAPVGCRGWDGTRYSGRETVGIGIRIRRDSDKQLQVERSVALRGRHGPNRRRHRGKKLQRELATDNMFDPGREFPLSTSAGVRAP